MKRLFICSFLLIVFLESSSLGGNNINKLASKTLRLEGIQRIYITVDLCPSSRKYEANLFNYLASIRAPVAVCVSGKWILKHEKELSAIKRLNLPITWVNHSYSHPIDNDFLNNPKVDFKHEVLDNVKLMEKYGLKPSKYFRFPGLVHNRQRLKELAKMGYINLDADAWLGKHQPIKDGSIVLIHGNGNEVHGVVDSFIQYLKTAKPKIIPVISAPAKPAIKPRWMDLIRRYLLFPKR